MPFPQYRALQGRESPLVCFPAPAVHASGSALTTSQLHYLQLLRLSSFRPGYQDWFLGPGWQEKKEQGLNAMISSYSIGFCFGRFFGSGFIKATTAGFFPFNGYSYCSVEGSFRQRCFWSIDAHVAGVIRRYSTFVGGRLVDQKLPHTHTPFLPC